MAPGTALIGSLVIALLRPQYRSWYGDGLPAFSQHFFDLYPLWIVVCTLALVVRAFSGALGIQAVSREQWKLLDAILGIASMLVIAAAIIALALPVFTRAEAI